jgi:broad specificity phosphatase PhoE
MYTKPQKIIYFFRHAQSEGNIRHIQATDEDIHPAEQHITDLGKQQAEKLADRLGNLNLEVLISSTLTRAKETTEIINQQHNYKTEYSDLFIERQKPSSIIGKLRNDEMVLSIEKAWKYSLFTTNQQVEDGDCYDSLVKRAQDCLEFLENRPESIIGVMTHGFFLNTIVNKAILGETLTPEIYHRVQEQHWLDNTGITALQYHPEYPYTGWKIWIYNDHSHLEYLKG